MPTHLCKPDAGAWILPLAIRGRETTKIVWVGAIRPRGGGGGPALQSQLARHAGAFVAPSERLSRCSGDLRRSHEPRAGGGGEGTRAGTFHRRQASHSD